MKMPVSACKLTLLGLALGFASIAHGATTNTTTTPTAPAAPATTPAKTPPAAPATAAKTPAAPAAPAAPDFGDGSSSTLTTKAWQALQGKDYAGVKAYTDQCIATFKTQAIQMQGTLKAPAPKASANQYWALNDVGSCYFIAAKALDEQGDKKGATADYKFLVDNLSYAQCWDPHGWFWPPAGAAKKRLA